MATLNSHETGRMAVSNLVNSTSVSPHLQDVELTQAGISIADMQTCPETIGGSMLASQHPANHYREYGRAPAAGLNSAKTKHREADVQPEIVSSLPSLMAYSAISRDHSKGCITSAMEPAIYTSEFDYAAPILPPPSEIYDNNAFESAFMPNLTAKQGHVISDRAHMPVSPRNFDYDEQDDDDDEPETNKPDEPCAGYARAEAFGPSLAPPTKAPLNKKRRAATFPDNQPKRLKSQESFASPASSNSQLAVSAHAKASPRIVISSHEKPVAAASENNLQPSASYPDGKVPLVDWKSLDIPESIWEEAQELYDQIKTIKAVQNRQPIRMKHAILAAIIVSLCRENNYPRTIAQICAASNVSKHEIHLYLRLMKQVLGKRYTLPQRASPSAFIQRWATVLELPDWVADVSRQVFDRADRMAIVQGKSPPSICATSMWLVIWCYNHRHALYQLGFDLPKDTVINSACVPCVPGLLSSSPSLDCSQYSMGSDNGNWCLIESDPGVFTELIQDMGVKDVQVEELYSLDLETLSAMEPVYGLIFLFKWQPGHNPPTKAPESSAESVYYAQQIIQNACATQAILSVLLNRQDIELGETLNNFRSFTIDLPSDMRGLALTNCDQIRDVHNSFVRPEAFLSDEKRPATEDDDVFHFISYVPVDGHLYELDGLRGSPVDHGKTSNWLQDVGTVIQKRMDEYSQSEIRFNLMAVIGDRRKILNKKIDSVDADISRLLQRLEALRLDDCAESREEATRVESQIGMLNSERAGLEQMVEMENDKFAKYKFDNVLRKHNFIPMVYGLLSGMAEKGTLESAMEQAKELAKKRPRQQNWQ
ncbi:hypothetical protein LPJ78_000254 [Coemansia sp. RSA 989]|nr:hypothetical protein LPJ78_000254 [Coemansia sp. RSA 989]KAJ1875571.1 hypothetical protein LPJ55_000564 [Coemansia sp. RSA 990]